MGPTQTANLSTLLSSTSSSVENEGPIPDFVDFTGDDLDEDVSESDAVPLDYCIPESDGNVVQLVNPNTRQVGPDYCLDQYGDPDVRGQFPGSDNDTTTPVGNETLSRRSHFHRRTFADTGATGIMNRWRRGSAVSICVERNNAYQIMYGSPSIARRASQVVNGVTIRAINLWNAGLNANYLQFEHVDDCRNAVFKVVTVDRTKPGAPKVLATAPFPPRGSDGARYREIYVWNTVWQNNFQNVLTTILAHELGHTIGLAHENCTLIKQACDGITAKIPGSIMNSGISPAKKNTFKGPTADDIEGTNAFYSLAAGGGSDPSIVLWPATRGALINYPPVKKCKWFLGVCYY